MSKGAAKSHAVIDGSNLATEGRNEPSLAQLDEAVRAIDAEFDFSQITVIVDATFEHRVGKSETKAARKAIDDGDILTPPAGVIGRGDAFILQVADRAKAAVFSNDSFQEFHGTYKWLFDEGRLIGGKPVPGVGWIYVARSPVRGPVSRCATADSRRSGAKDTTKATPRKKAESASTGQSSSTGQTKRTRKPSTQAPPKPTAATPPPGKKASRSRAKPTASGDGSNDPTVWATFKDDFPVGSTIAAHVDRFSSHGAYGSVDDVVVYLPNRLLGDPPPTKARDVLELGETVDFVVHRYDDDRHGIDAGLVPAPGTTSTPRRAPRKAPAKKAAAKKAAAKKATTRRTPAKKTAAKKATAKKSTARKAPAKKTAAKKATTKKSTAKSTARKTPAKKTAAKKTPAKRTSKKAAASKRTARR